MKKKSWIKRILEVAKKLLHPKELWVSIMGTPMVRMIKSHAEKVRKLCEAATILKISTRLVSACEKLSSQVFKIEAVRGKFEQIKELINRIRSSLKTA